MDRDLDNLLKLRPYSLPQADKEKVLIPLMLDLTKHHRKHCFAYRRITDLTAPDFASARCLEDLPFLPTSLFKLRRLRSISPDAVRTTVTSSGTTGSQPSQIDLDESMAHLSSHVLSRTLHGILGDKRRPFLVLDSENVLHNGSTVKARGAAILGLMPFGHDICFALDNDMTMNRARVDVFLNKFAHDPFLIFGFTFMVWQSLLGSSLRDRLDLSHAILLHSGGWKTLEEKSIDNAVFKQQLNEVHGLQRVINFYGMAELPGTIFIENEDGLLYPPLFADVIIRNPIDLTPVSDGQQGLIQIISALPRSYPGHSLLTEDMGMISRIDSGTSGWMGKGFRLSGRAPRSQLRGCSNVIAESYFS